MVSEEGGKMKIKFYCDINNGAHMVDPDWLMFSTKPTKKMDGYTRYRIVVDLPDKHFTADASVDIDADLIEKAVEI